MASTHAKNRPPSAAHRWIPCPFSAMVAPLYPNEDSEQSLKGDYQHKLMEVMIEFGTLPLDVDPDAAEHMEDLYAFVMKCFKEAGPGARIFIEREIQIPQTGEFGTGDIIIVSPTMIIVIDYKSGYVAVNIVGNEQLLTYLMGLIAEFGPRPRYMLAIHQPNFDHIQGPIRTWEPNIQDLATHEYDVHLSMTEPDRVQAGPHCKATYCEHRGACAAFAEYALNDLALGWHTSELKGMDDATLAKALDASDELGGWRAELRGEAMRRISNQDRKIDGYKLVKGRRSRSVSDAKALVLAVRDQLGLEWARRLYPDLVWVQDLPIDREEVLKHLGTPKHIEDVLKQYARQMKLPRNGWKMLYDNVVSEYIRETAMGLTLERAIDGRPAHKRGSEFGVIDPANANKFSTVL